MQKKAVTGMGVVTLAQKLTLTIVTGKPSHSVLLLVEEILGGFVRNPDS